MFLYLSWLVFSERLRVGVFGGNSAIASNIASILPFLLLQVFLLRTCCTFGGCPAVLGDFLLLFVWLFSQSFFSLLFSLGTSVVISSSSKDVFLAVSSPETFEDILRFCDTGFDLWHFFFIPV